jgi:hypothetical protein
MYNCARFARCQGLQIYFEDGLLLANSSIGDVAGKDVKDWCVELWGRETGRRGRRNGYLRVQFRVQL